jgi:hypothetical protein
MRCANRGSARPGTASDVITFRVVRGDVPPQVSQAPTVNEAPTAAESRPSPRPAVVQTPAAPSSPTATAPGSPISVTAISVEAGSSQVAITISTSGPPAYKTMALSGPERLVIDILGGAMKAPRAQQRIDVAALGVSRVRAAQFKNDPAIARIVVDMDARLDSAISVEDNNLVVRLKAKQ